MVSDSEGFAQPRINRTKCIECGLCRRICPVLSPLEKNNGKPECFGFKTRDRDILQSSSSGGAFTSLALPVIRSGGAVFGCVMGKPDFVAHHVMAETEFELVAMRGSKYVQSDIRNAFIKCKAELENGRQVLFSGTSCQIAGLKAFLGKNYPNLLTVDFICHGVPSPAVWKHYKEQCERASRSSINKASFRNKHYSWKKFSLALSYDNVSSISINPLGQDLYLRAFIGNYCLRKCCYTCSFKPGHGAVSDITIADFWGIEKVRPDFFDELGVSAVILHTLQGKQAFAVSQTNADVMAVSLDEVTLHNPSYFKGVASPSGRDFFMRHFRHVRTYRRLLGFAGRYPFGKWFMDMLMRKVRHIKGRK